MIGDMRLGAVREAWFWAGVTVLVAGLYALFRGFDGLYGQDAYGYANQAKHLQVWWQGGAPPPPYFWTSSYPGLGALLMRIFPEVKAALPMQLISILALGGTVAICTRWLQDRVAGARFAGVVAFLSIGLSPFLFRCAISVMSDSLTIFWTSLCIWQGSRYWKRGDAKHLAWAAFAAGAAVMTRYSVAPFLALPMLFFGFQALRWGKWTHLGCLLLAALPVIPELLLPHPASPYHASAAAWDIGRFFQSEYEHLNDGHLSHSQVNIVHVMAPLWNPGYLGAIGLCMPLLLVLVSRRDKAAWLLLACFLVYALFLAGLPVQNPRFMLPTLPLLLVVVFPSLHFFLGLLPSPFLRNGMVGLAILLSGIGVVLASRSILAARSNEKVLVAKLKEVAPSQRVYTLGLEAALEYDLPHLKVQSLFPAQIPPPQSGDLVLSQFPWDLKQWKDEPAGQHWKKWEQDSLLEFRIRFDQYWDLYEIR